MNKKGIHWLIYSGLILLNACLLQYLSFSLDNFDISGFFLIATYIGLIGLTIGIVYFVYDLWISASQFLKRIKKQ